MDRVHKAPAVANFVKLQWFNDQHLRMKANTDISSLVTDAKTMIHQKYGAERFSDAYIAQVITVMKERLSSLNDVTQFCSYFFEDPKVGPQHELHSKMWKSNSGMSEMNDDLVQAVLVDKLAAKLEQDPSFTVASISDAYAVIAKELNVSLGELYNLSRYLLTGSKIGAPVPPTVEILGKETVVKRLRALT